MIWLTKPNIYNKMKCNIMESIINIAKKAKNTLKNVQTPINANFNIEVTLIIIEGQHQLQIE